jgi:hypothetical protein
VARRDIERLTGLEQQWLTRQHEIVHDRGNLSEQTGVYDAWRDIFRQYALLAGQDMEALKRAIYLCWTERSQDPLLSGVKDLDQQAIRTVLDVANELAETDRLDAELRWMLPYYYLVEPSYLDTFEDLDDLKRTSRQGPLLHRRECATCSFENRGHMGQYWKSKRAILRLWP